MPAAVTDTHSLIWYLEDSPRLGQAAGEFFDACARGENTVFVPTICLWRSCSSAKKDESAPNGMKFWTESCRLAKPG